ncbi:MAG: hypothetical protein QY318_02340 [Candidatus Dojkabacteria bacterium]|nr:MAG: hypothetical protein QY318_02340 [Candidatus Dojkabacteria bacterium]
MNKPLNNNLLLELHIPDFNVAKDFYGKLGFKIAVEDPITEEYCGYLTMVHKDPAGDTLLAFYGGDEKVYDQSYFKNFPRDTKRGYGVELTVPVKDVRKKYGEVQGVLGKFVVQEMKEKRDHEHVWYDFRMEDPFGYYLRFTDLLDWGQG